MICEKCKTSEILGKAISEEEREVAQANLWKLAKVTGSDLYDFVETLMALIMRMDEHISRLEEEVEKLRGEV